MEKPRYLDIWTMQKLTEASPGDRDDPDLGKDAGGVGEVGCEKEFFESSLTREAIDQYTVGKLRETLAYAIAGSAFYKERFGEAAGKLFSEAGKEAQEDFLTRFARLPFTMPEDLKTREMDLLCVRPGEISRIVTLDTGGSTGTPKRIYFTEADQQLTVDFFGNGMQLLVDKTDKVLILMPAKMPGSIGNLLAHGLQNFGVESIPYGLPRMGPAQDGGQNRREVARILTLMRERGVTSVVALPTHMRMLSKAEQEHREAAAHMSGYGVASGAGSAEHMNSSQILPEALSLKSVLLSAEYVSDDDADLIGEVFGCKVYEHYGMTEMGLGCAVSCGQGEGYHIREADLYVELIEPETGQVITDDRLGEVVFTTLTRKGMPFIRYRTGDYSRWITEPCRCGSVLKRLSKVGGRTQVKGYLR